MSNQTESCAAFSYGGLVNTHEAYKPYQDSFGLVHPSRQIANDKGELPISENGIRFTVEMGWAKLRSGEDEFKIDIDLLYTILTCQKRPALFERHPEQWKHRPIGPDDLLFLALFCEMFRYASVAQRILSYTRRHLYFYDNRSPKRLKNKHKTFVFRQWQLFVAFKIAAGEKLNCVDIRWTTKVIEDALHRELGDQDGWCLSCALVKITRNVGDFKLQAARQAWIQMFRMQYPNGYGEVLSRKATEGRYKGRSYFEADHPTCEYMIGEHGE